MVEKMFFISCFFNSNILLSFLQAFENESVCITEETKQHYYKNVISNFADYHLSFRNFRSFDELELNCSNKYNILKYKEDRTYLNLHFKPWIPIILKKSFTDFLTNAFYLNDLLQYDETVIVLLNVLGIENNLFKPNENMAAPFLVLAFSNFDFYIKGKKINDSMRCPLLNGANTFFRQFNYIMLTKVKYPAFLCPNIFVDSSVDKITMNDISNSLLIKNK